MRKGDNLIINNVLNKSYFLLKNLTKYWLKKAKMGTCRPIPPKPKNSCE